MATYAGKDVAIIAVGGYDLRPDTTQAMTVSKDAMVEDVTPFGVQDQLQGYAGERKLKWGVKGLYNDAAGASNAAAAAELCTNLPGMLGPAGNTQGNNLIMFAGLIGKQWDRSFKMGSFTTYAVEFSGTGEIDEGVIHHVLQAETANGNTTSIDGGAGNAPSASGAAIMLQVTALTLGSATNLLVKLQDSTDNSSFADVSGGGFTVVTAAPAAQRVVISGNIRRYTRVLFSWTGGAGGGSTATFAVGFYRGTTTSVPV